ncbi:MAG: DUF1343 domain-containing protein [Ignavibacteriae bacterium]|nr:DUF1343 domain-containing protein [Ignavibacteriota bacterium]
MKKILLILIAGLLTIYGFTNRKSDKLLSTGSFMLGNEVLLNEKLELLKNKNAAVITNKTGVLSGGKLFFEALINKGVNVVKIFTPEHGFESDDNYKNTGIDIPVISLYGKNKNIIDADLEDVDVLIFDIQELGVRYYTYTSTLYLTMQDASRNGKKFIICDRPSISNPNYFDGFMLNKHFSSFVGMIPTPIMYGMTIGELGTYLRSTINNRDFDFEVIKMKNYTRSLKYEDLNLPWVNPSPNIVNLECSRLYPSLCFMEGTNISEGRGTDTPFKQFGAPFCNAEELKFVLNSFHLEGVSFNTVKFTPYKKISSYEPKFMNQECSGISIEITDYSKYRPVEVSIAILYALKASTKEFKWIENNYIDKLAGTGKLRTMLNESKSFKDIVDSYNSEIETFGIQRAKYLLYN